MLGGVFGWVLGLVLRQHSTQRIPLYLKAFQEISMLLGWVLKKYRHTPCSLKGIGLQEASRNHTPCEITARFGRGYVSLIRRDT